MESPTGPRKVLLLHIWLFREYSAQMQAHYHPSQTNGWLENYALTEQTDNNSPKDHHHLQGYTDIGYHTRQAFGTKVTLGNSGSAGRTLKRDTSCSIQVSISCALMLPLWSISIVSSKSNATLWTVSPSLAIPAIICCLDSSVGGAWPDATTLAVLDSAANVVLLHQAFPAAFPMNVKNLRNATYTAARSSGKSSHGLHAVVEVSHGSQV